MNLNLNHKYLIRRTDKCNAYFADLYPESRKTADSVWTSIFFGIFKNEANEFKLES